MRALERAFTSLEAPNMVKDALQRVLRPGEVADGTGAPTQKGPSSGRPFPESARRCSALLRLPTLVGRRPVAPLGHKLVELRLVFRGAQAPEELAELFLDPVQSLCPVLVESAVAARGVPAEAGSTAHSGAHPVHLALHALHLVLPAVRTAVISATHASAPYREEQDGKPERPEDPEARDDQRDPGSLAEFVDLGGDWHDRPRVNVNNIYIDKPRQSGCQ